ncbi:unnamed protein product [Effrenium voratum]|nr:unnamed protein product [Effrenium voratum]
MQGDRDPTDALVAKYNQGQDSDEEDNDDYGIEVRPPKPFVDTPVFNMCLGLVIALNSVTIGLETDSVAHAVATQEAHDDRLWYIVELIFCVIFLFELLLRLYFHRLRYFTNPVTRAWNIADFIIVSVSVVDTLILIPFGIGGTARVVAMLRFVRMMRLARLLRLLKLFKELWLMVSGLLQSLKTLGWICLVALLFCYACAIITTTVIGHNDEIYDPYFSKSGGWDHEVYFATVWRSTFTLFQIMTLDQWNESVVRHVVANQPAMLIFFLVFVCISSLGLMSIMIGVVVENTLATANKDQNKLKARRERDRKQVFGQLQEIFEMADVDGSGTLKLEEVEAAIQKPEIYNKLKMIDFPVDDPGQIFALLDYDESGELTTEEFITGCIRMKGPAKSKDLLVAQVGVDSMRKQYALFEQEMEKFQAKVAMLDATIRAVMSHGEHVFLDTRQYRMRHPDFKAQTKRFGTTEFENMPWNKPEDAKDAAAIMDTQQEPRQNLPVICNISEARVEDVITEEDIAMRRTLEVQSVAMRQTLETQGRQVTRLIAFGGLTAIFSKFWQDLPAWLKYRRWAVAATYGLGVVAILLGATAGVVSLLRGLWGTPEAAQVGVPFPAQPLPTLAPAQGSEARILKHNSGLCVGPEGAQLALVECGAGFEGIRVFAAGDSVQLRLGSKCAIADEADITLAACGRNGLFKKVLVGTDLFLLQHLDSRKCVVPVGKAVDGTRLTTHSSCEGDKAINRFQTSEAAHVEVPVEVASYNPPVAPVAPKPQASGGVQDTLVHSSGMCVKASEDVTGEDSTVLVFSSCDDEPAKNIKFVESGGVSRFQLGRQCAHPETGPDASSEPRMAFPADCLSTRHSFGYRKLAEDERLAGFVIQSTGPTTLCIHPFQGSERPSDGTELINHQQCDAGRQALRFRVGDPAKLASEEVKLKVLGNPLIPVPSQEACSYYGEGRSQSSRPGKPCIPPPPFWPYKGLTEWKTELGSRALAAVTPLEELTGRCGGYYLFGDQTWCNEAFDGSHGYGKIGLSFGIEERDIWGELVTQKFGLPVKLFDCFIEPEKSPPIAGTPPNGTKCPKNHVGEPKLDYICYGAPYQSFRLCLAGQEVKVDGRMYGTLEAQLRGWPKLSVHLKIDVEGSEWDVLEWLIDNPDEWDKVRTLDMEIHFGFGSAAELSQFKALDLQQKLTRQVQIMEGLTRRFYCTGSTLEVYRQGWSPQDNCGTEPCHEPPIYLPNAFSVTAFAVSYVHKELVG